MPTTYEILSTVAISSEKITLKIRLKDDRLPAADSAKANPHRTPYELVHEVLRIQGTLAEQKAAARAEIVAMVREWVAAAIAAGGAPPDFSTAETVVP